MPTYTPPPGGSITFDFGASTYAPPNGSSVTLDFDATGLPTIYASGIFADGYGLSYIYLGQRWLLPTGIASTTAFGAHGIEHEKLKPDGIGSTLDFGAATVWLGQHWIYPTPIVVEAQAGHSVFRDDWYVVPGGSSVVLDFGATPYTPPPGGSVTLEFEPSGTPTLYPAGIAQAAYGSVSVVNLLQEASASGISQDAYGTAIVELSTRYLVASGFDANALGSPELLLDAHEITPQGIDPGELGFAGDGEGAISLGRRALEPTSIDASLYGASRVESTIREVDLAGSGVAGTLFGTQFIAYKERFLEPPYIFANAFGTATLGFDRALEPAGLDASLFGVANVHDNAQSISSITSIHDGVVSAPDVTRSPRHIEAIGFDLNETAPSERWGRPDVVNLTQILPRVAIDPDPENGGVFGEPNNTLVANRNRTIVHYGHLDSKVSGLATLDNAGRALVVSGNEETTWGSHLVAPAIRTYELDGVEPPWFTPYHAVHNDAFQVLPGGIDQSAIGTPAWANPPQALTFVGHIDSQEHGTAFVDFAIRSIATPLGPEAVVGMPDVQLGMRYLLPVGLEATKWGSTYVYEHFNIAAAHSILSPAMGEPYVRNVTPEVMPYGYEQTEWGRPEVRFNPYPLSPDGFAATQFGGLVIRDRTQTVLQTPVGIGGVGMFAQVRNDTPDPPAAQNVVPTGALHTGYGTASLRRMEIDAGGYVFTTFGSHEVRLIGAIVPSMVAPDAQVPSPQVSGPRTLSASGVAAPDDPASGFSPTKHDLSPRTVWATFDVTDQALENHPGAWVLMDDHLDTEEPRGQRPFFGSPAVSLKSRVVSVGPAAAGMSPVEMPTPAIESTIRTVYPVGKLMQRFGVPSLPGEQILDHNFGGFADAVMGEPFVENQHRQLHPSGVAAPGITGQDIQNQHRSLPPSSIGVGIVGTPRVHPPEPVIPGMGIQTLWGTAMVADRIRTVYPSGWDSFTTGDELGGFSGRMRVLKRYPLRPVSIDDGALGAPRVSNAIQVVEHITLPAPGRPPAPEIAINTKVALGGLGLWYEDHGQTVITHGDNMEFVCGESSRAIPIAGSDMSAFGVASLEEVVSLVRRIYPAAIDQIDLSDPRVASSLNPSSMYDGAVSDPYVSYEIFAYGFDSSALGGASVQSAITPSSIDDGAITAPTVVRVISPPGWLDSSMDALYVDVGYFDSDYVANDSGVSVSHG